MQDFFFQILQVFYLFRDQMSYIINYAFQNKFSSFWIDPIDLDAKILNDNSKFSLNECCSCISYILANTVEQKYTEKKCLPVKGHFQLGKNSPKVAHINMHSQKKSIIYFQPSIFSKRFLQWSQLSSAWIFALLITRKTSLLIKMLK